MTSSISEDGFYFLVYSQAVSESKTYNVDLGTLVNIPPPDKINNQQILQEMLRKCDELKGNVTKEQYGFVKQAIEAAIITK